MTTENIYICTVRKSRHSKHKVMYSQKVFYIFHLIFDMINMSSTGCSDNQQFYKIYTSQKDSVKKIKIS